MTLLKISGAAALACMLLAACGAGGEEDDGLTLHRGNGAEPLTLDPHKLVMSTELAIIHDLYSGLYNRDATGAVVPGLAESVDISDDGLTWTFTLRDAQWSDGVAITAEDAALGIRRSIDPATLNSLAINLFFIENAAAANRGELPVDAIGVEAIDDRTLVVRLAFQAPYIRDVFAALAFPVPGHVIEAHGDDWFAPENLATSGAYTLTQWRSNQFVRLDRNAQFYDASNVCFETVFYHPMPDSQAAERRVRAGELDLTPSVSMAGVELLSQNAPELLRRSSSYLTWDLVFNSRRPPLDDVRVREALSMAIDRRFLSEDIQRGTTQPNWRHMSPLLPSADGAFDLSFRDEDMETRRDRARALLADAGYGPEQPLQLTLSFFPHFARAAPVIQQDWAAIAPWVSTELFQTDAQLHYASLRAGDFDVGYSGWNPDFADPYGVLYGWQSASGDANYSGWTDPEFDALLDAAAQERDPDARLALLGQAERVLLNAHPQAPLFTEENYDLVRPDITGWVANPAGQNPSRWLCRDGLEPQP